MGTAGSKGAIFVVTERPNYIGGEVVNGTAHLQLNEPVPIHGIFLKLKGVEHTWWEEARTRTITTSNADGTTSTRSETYYVSFSGTHAFYRLKFPLYPMAATLAGCFSFPFTFVLPPGLPGSFRYTGSRARAHIKYVFKAEVLVDGIFKSNIRHKVEVMVNNRPPLEIAPAVREVTSSVRFFCCFNKGDVWMRASFDKNAYVPGETTQIILEVDNRSTQELRRLMVRLMRELVLTDNTGYTHRFTERVVDTSFPGVPPKTLLTGPNARYLPVPLTPKPGDFIQASSDSRLIKCRYYILVQCDLQCAPDIKLDLPTTIYNPVPVYVMPPPPPGWAPQMMAAVNVEMSDRYKY